MPLDYETCLKLVLFVLVDRPSPLGRLFEELILNEIPYIEKYNCLITSFTMFYRI